MLEQDTLPDGYFSMLSTNDDTVHEQTLQIPNFEQVISECGGYGLFQAVSSTSVILVAASKGILIYGMPYFLLYPIYECYLQDGTSIDKDST